MYTDTFDQSKNDKDVKTFPESPGGSGSSEYSHSKSEVIDGNRSSMGSEGLVDIITRGERTLESDKSNWSETYTNDSGSILEPARRSSSSSSSESSLNNGFELETVDFESKESRPVSKDEQNDVSSHSSSTSEDDDNSLVPTSTLVPATVSPPPPVQVMDQSAGYDPNRIPSSVFARNTSPMEWSTASNESLFSIQLGNTSFSRDNASMFNDLYKSGELAKSGELCSQPSFAISDDKKIDEENVDVEDLQKEKKLEETSESEDRFNENQNNVKSLQPDIISNPLNVSGRSQCSGTSTCSFAFPILIEADRLSSPKVDVPLRHSDEEPYVPPKEDTSEVPRRSRAKCCNWFCCFSWSPCWKQGRCFRRRCC